MSSKIATLPVTEPAMWRKLLAAVHPDGGGSHELFIWTMNLRKLVCEKGLPSRTVAPPPPKGSAEQDRVPFDGSVDFTKLTWRALGVACEEDTPQMFSKLLWLLGDFEKPWNGKERDQQSKGATYKQLALIAHRAGMTNDQRRRWYKIAERIPLSMRHASILIERLGG